jgi:hypothetical protein
MTRPNDQAGIWLTAEYTFASLFSYRIPMSSSVAAQALPTPGPATVRLALVRTGFELFGEDITRNDIFPTIRAMAVRIQPPERVALTWQTLCAYKATKKQDEVKLTKAPIQREMVHTAGVVRIALTIPSVQERLFRELLEGIGYWGQASGLAWCTRITNDAPDAALCIRPMRLMHGTQQVATLFSRLATEFRSNTVEWEEVIPELSEQQSCAIKPEAYVWPLRVCEQHSAGQILERCSIR